MTISLKDVFLVRENTLKSDLIFLLQRDQRGYVYVFMFFLAVQHFFSLDRFGRKTDWHILFRSMFSMFSTPSVPLNFEEYAVQTCSTKIRRIGIQYALGVFIVQRPNSTPMQSRRCAKYSNLFFSSLPTPILWSFTNRVILLVLWCCYGQICLLDVRILCTEPWFCHWEPSAPKKIDKPGYVRYNTFFHAPKNNEGESNLTLITWFCHRRPLILLDAPD